jgi:competence protein ComEC
LFGADLPYSTELKNDFKLSGTLHLIAVSGFNINLVGNGIMQLSVLFGRRKISILTSIILYLYYLLVGWESIPCLRAFIMYTFDTFGKSIGRKSGLFQSLGFSLLIISIIWPYSLFDFALQLSFLASFGLILLQVIIKKFNIIHIKWYVSAFLTSLSCSLATLPILIRLGNLPSYRTLIANTITSPLIIYTVLLGVFTLISELILGFRIDVLVMLTDLILQTLLFFISFSARL